jgi:glucosamine-6-phosphate deaminase
MNIIQAVNYEDMSQKAAERIITAVRKNKQLSLGLATGGTPIYVYKKLVEDHKKNHTCYKKVTTVNLDEYVGSLENHPNSYHYYMYEHLFDHIDLLKEQIHIPNGAAENTQDECEGYEKLLNQLGGVDIQLLGIGENGHIGFNEPGTPFDSTTHIVELKESTRRANARFFSDFSEVPTHAITMGISSIMKSKEIILLISGEKKEEALHRLLTGEISEEFPASVLRRHSNMTIITDLRVVATT